MISSTARLAAQNKELDEMLEAAILSNAARNEGKNKLSDLTLKNLSTDLENKASRLQKENAATLSKFDASMAKEYAAFTKRQADELELFKANQKDTLASYKAKILVEKELRHPKWSQECRRLLGASKKLANEKKFEEAREKQNAAYDLQKEEQEAFDKKEADRLEYLTTQFEEKQKVALQSFTSKQAVEQDKLNAKNAARREHLVAVQDKEVARGNLAQTWETAHCSVDAGQTRTLACMHACMHAQVHATPGIQVFVGPRVVPGHMDKHKTWKEYAPRIPPPAQKMNAKNLEGDKTKCMHSVNSVHNEEQLLSKL